MGGTKIYPAIMRLGLAIVARVSAPLMYRIREGTLRPSPTTPAANPVPPSQPLHYVSETSGIVHQVTEKMMESPKLQNLPLDEFLELRQTRVELAIIQDINENEADAPGSHHDYLGEGPARSEDKLKTDEERIRKQALGHRNEKGKEENKEKKEQIAHKRSRSNNMRQRRRWKQHNQSLQGVKEIVPDGVESASGEEGNLDDSEVYKIDGEREERVEGVEDGASEGTVGMQIEGEAVGTGHEGVGANGGADGGFTMEGVEQEGNEGEDSADDREPKPATAQRKRFTEVDLAVFPIPGRPLRLDPTKLLPTIDLSHIRFTHANREGESLLRSVTDPDPLQRPEDEPEVAHCQYFNGGTAAQFKYPADRTVSTLVDNDQFGTGNLSWFDWIVQKVRLGRTSYLANAIEPSAGSPILPPLESEKQPSVHCKRLIHVPELIPTLFKDYSSDVISAVMLLCGNEYFRADGIAPETLLEADHAPLLDFFLRKTTLYGAAIDNSEEENIVRYSKEWENHRSKLPQSKELETLDLKKLWRLQQTTKGTMYGKEFKKEDLMKRVFEETEKKVETERAEKMQEIVDQVKESKCSNKSRPHNHQFIARSLWPDSPPDEYLDETPRSEDPRLTDDGKDLPFHRERNPAGKILQKQLDLIDDDKKTEPTTPPDLPDPPVLKSTKLEDLKNRWRTVQRSPTSVYSSLLPTNNAGNVMKSDDSMFHAVSWIRATMTPELAAGNEAWGRCLDLALENVPSLFFELELDVTKIGNRMESVFRERVKLGNGQPGPSVQETWGYMYRLGAAASHAASGDEYSAPDVATRLQPSITSMAVASFNHWTKKLKDDAWIRDLFTSLLLSPDTSIPKIYNLVHQLFPNFHSEDATPLPQRTVELWKLLEESNADKSSLFDDLIAYVLSGEAPEWEKRETKQETALPDFPPDLQQRIRARFETLLLSPDSPNAPLAQIGIVDVINATNSLAEILRRIARLLPLTLVEFVACALRGSTNAPQTHTSSGRQMKTTQPTDLEGGVRAALPAQRSIRTLLTEMKTGKSGSGAYKGMESFKLFILAAAGTIKHKFDPDACVCTPEVVYYYVTPTVSDPTPPLIQALDNLHDNEDRAMTRAVQAIKDAGTLARPKKEVDIVKEPQAGGGKGSSNPLPDQSNSTTTGGGGLEAKEVYGAKASATRFCSSLDAKTRKATFDPQNRKRDQPLPRSSPALDSDEYDQSRRFPGRNINGLHRLIPAQRIATISHSYPHLQISEPLASASAFDIARKQPEEGFVKFASRNKERSEKVCHSVRTIFESVIAVEKNKTGTKTYYRGVIMNLRAEFMNLLFGCDRPGIYLPWGFTVTLTTINLLYRDARWLDKFPEDTSLTYVDLIEKLVVHRSYVTWNPEGVQEVTRIVNKHATANQPKYKEELRNVRSLMHVTPTETERTNNTISRNWNQSTALWIAARTPRPKSSDSSPSSDSSASARSSTNSGSHSTRSSSPSASVTSNDSTVLDLSRQIETGFWLNSELEPLLVDLKFEDPDNGGASLWRATTKKQKEMMGNVEKMESNQERLKWETRDRRDDDDDDEQTMYLGVDRGKVVYLALCWLNAQTKQGYTDLIRRNRAVGNQRTRSKVVSNLSELIGVDEKDDIYRQLNTHPNKDNQGTKLSIDDYNSHNSNAPLSTRFGRTSAIIKSYGRQQKAKEESELERIITIQINSMMPPTEGKTWRLVIFDGADDLPTSSGTSGPDKDRVIMEMFLRCLRKRSDISYTVFLINEFWTSQSCSFCLAGGIFHPESVVDGHTINRSTACEPCGRIAHRDGGSALLILLSGLLGGKTGYHLFSPAHEVTIYGRNIPQRREDQRRLRPKKANRAKYSKRNSELWLHKQRAAFRRAKILAQKRRDLLEAFDADQAEKMLEVERRLLVELDEKLLEDEVALPRVGTRKALVEEPLTRPQGKLPTRQHDEMRARIARAGGNVFV
ncbi:hypothetical protein JCM5353_001609 [Sporobolomyces roseus]